MKFILGLNGRQGRWSTGHEICRLEQILRHPTHGGPRERKPVKNVIVRTEDACPGHWEGLWRAACRILGMPSLDLRVEFEIKNRFMGRQICIHVMAFLDRVEESGAQR